MLDIAVGERTSNVCFIERGQSVKIEVPLPKQVLVSDIKNIDDVHKKVSELSPFIIELAISAFVDDDKDAWDMVQRLLYYWNYRDLMRIDRVRDHTPLVEYALRQIVLNIQVKHTPIYHLECIKNFTPERAVDELAEKALSHRINQHPLLEKMMSDGLNVKGVRLFLENYYINNRLFHLFIAALSFSTPMVRRAELANNFYDEMGSGDAFMAHPLLFLKSFNTLGQPTCITPQPESLSLVNAKTHVAFYVGIITWVWVVLVTLN